MKVTKEDVIFTIRQQYSPFFIKKDASIIIHGFGHACFMELKIRKKLPSITVHTLFNKIIIQHIKKEQQKDLKIKDQFFRGHTLLLVFNVAFSRLYWVMYL